MARARAANNFMYIHTFIADTMASVPSSRELVSLTTLQLLSENIQENLTEWLGSSKRMSIFVSGKTGGGKSALVNALVGENVAVEGAEPDPMTVEVKCYERNIQGIALRVWDSPGLQDGTRNEERYIKDMRAKNCADADLFLFCINIADTIKFTVDSSEVKALAKLTEAFGRSLWNHAVIALTFANRVWQKNAEMKVAKRRNNTERLKELFISKICEWDKCLRGMLENNIGLESSQVAKLTIIPTGFRTDPSLPDRAHWLSTFWFSVLHSTHARAQPALLLMNETRIVEKPESVDDASRRQHCQDQKFIFTKYGRTIGSRYGLEDIGSFIGLTIAQLKTCQLVECILLEQYYLLRILEQRALNGGSRSGQQQQQDEEKRTPSSDHSHLPPLQTVGTAPVDVPSVEMSPVLISPRSECGGYPD